MLRVRRAGAEAAVAAVRQERELLVQAPLEQVRPARVLLVAVAAVAAVREPQVAQLRRVDVEPAVLERLMNSDRALVAAAAVAAVAAGGSLHFHLRATRSLAAAAGIRRTCPWARAWSIFSDTPS